MIDLKYTFMLQSFGLVRSNLLKEFVYRRPSWYAMIKSVAFWRSRARVINVHDRINA